MGVLVMGLVLVAIPTPAWAATPWSIVPSPNKSASNDNGLRDVSCVSASSCVAVGQYTNGSGVLQTLTESWNGSSWSISSSPNSGVFDNVLSGVSCVSATSCIAVGDHLNGSGFHQTLIESWNGTTWSITSSPNHAATHNVLSDVWCASASSCVAVGSYVNGGTIGLTLIESWNGTTWSITSSPSKGSNDNTLNGVSCISASSCVAVGNYRNGISSPYQTLIESWNGASWSVITSPNSGVFENLLNGVSCVSATSCITVGSHQDGSGFDETLAESWNGSSWAITPSPNGASNSYNFLHGASCVSASSCIAAGYYVAGGIDRTMIESWNGTAWSIVSSPNTGADNNLLSGVSCVPASLCRAVGSYVNGSLANQTLVESWNGVGPIVNSVTPNTGVTTGSTAVAIAGSGFTGATGVSFGGVPATGVVVHSDNSITAVSPARSAGVVDVQVTTAAGVSAITPADQFTYTVQETPTSASCNPSCLVHSTSPLDTTSVVVAGAQTTGTPKVSVVTNTGVLACGKAFNYRVAITTVTPSGFLPTAKPLTITETVAGLPTTKGVQVCFLKKGATTPALLKVCTKTAPVPPCVVSLVKQRTGVKVTFLAPPQDPRFYVGGPLITFTGFSPAHGPFGSPLTITGTNLLQVTAITVGGVLAPAKSATATKLVVTVPRGARTGYITLVCDSSVLVSPVKFQIP
jgi:hypothetical protein